MNYNFNTYQCKRNVCKKADKPSIITRIAIVNIAQNAKITNNAIPPTGDVPDKPCCNTIFHNTSDNSKRKDYIEKCLKNLYYYRILTCMS